MNEHHVTNIALFGTSADPPTAGHQKILRWLGDRFDWVAVWASDNPFKSHQTPLEHRARMLRLLIEDIDTPRRNIAIHPELSSPKTLEAVQRAKQKWPEANLTLAVGSDLLPQLPQWHRIDELLGQIHLLAIPRPGYPISSEDIERLRAMGADLDLADLEAPAVSSTAYRDRGETEVLIPQIEDYIHREQLYAWQDAS